VASEHKSGPGRKRRTTLMDGMCPTDELAPVAIVVAASDKPSQRQA
jgi:hypothetical protein